jgi:AcrR family transcriptional regulator
MLAMHSIDTDFAPERVSPEKMRQIVLAARDLFMSKGFSATSMEAIARAAGVGKATLYANFPRKVAVFGAVISGESAMRDELVLGEPETEAPLLDTLMRFAEGFIDLLLSPTNLAMYRVVSAEATRFPELGHIFYAQGPSRIIETLGDYLANAMQRGELAKGPPALVAAQFIGLIRADLQTRAMLGVDENPNAEVRRTAVEAGVRAFLRAYGPSTSRGLLDRQL